MGSKIVIARTAAKANKPWLATSVITNDDNVNFPGIAADFNCVPRGSCSFFLGSVLERWLGRLHW